MNRPATDTHSMVKGPWMRRLDLYVAAGAPTAIEAMLSTWRTAGQGFNGSGNVLENDAGKVEEGFSETSLSGTAAKRDMQQSSAEVQKKYKVISDAEIALGTVRFQVDEAMKDHAVQSAKLPESHEPVNRADYKTEVVPGEVNERQAREGQDALDKALSDHAARERAIADAETVAAARIRDYDNAVDEAEPKVRALYDDGSGQSNVPSNPAATPTTIPGSASAIAAAQARMAKYNPGVSYAEGDGYDLIQREKELIAAEEAKNQPEWNGTEWINADGTSAPATSYASIETANGLAPLSGGSSGAGGAAALAVGLGGAALAGGIAKAVASKFATPSSAAGKAQVAKAAGATSRTAAGARGTAASGRSLSGAGSRAAGGSAAGSRSAGRGGPGAAGSRAGRGAGAAGGRGAGTAGNRGTRGKDDRQNGQDQDWQADYTDDWTDPDYRVWDPKTDSGRPTERTGEGVDKKSDGT